MASKRTRELQRLITPLGWEIVGIRNNGHYALRNRTTGAEYSAPYSGGDRRGMLNLAAQLKRIDRGGRG